MLQAFNQTSAGTDEQRYRRALHCYAGSDVQLSYYYCSYNRRGSEGPPSPAAGSEQRRWAGPRTLPRTMHCVSSSPLLSRPAPLRASRARSAAVSRHAVCASLQEPSAARRAGLAACSAALAVALASPAFAKARRASRRCGSSSVSLPSLPPQPADFGVYWVAPANNASVTSPFTVKMGVKGLELKPACASALALCWLTLSHAPRLAAEGLAEGTGHHHILVDGSFLKAGEVVPFDETHLHFGKAQTEAVLTLPPGKHTLTLQFANALHKSYGKGYSKSLSVTVLPTK